MGAARGEMEALGYVEEEFLLRGRASAYHWAGVDKVGPVAGPTAYCTRILVRRPADPMRFSGRVVLEILNASYGYDVSGVIRGLQPVMTANGDAFVGVTSKSICVRALKKADPIRYASLQWGRPAGRAVCEGSMFYGAYRRDAPSMISSPESEDGLFWDMYTQTGHLLRSKDGGGLLPGMRCSRLYGAGASQSSYYLNAYIEAFGREGGPPFDGYLPFLGSRVVKLSQCAGDLPEGDPRLHNRSGPTPVVLVNTQGDVSSNPIGRRDDSDAPNNRFRLYEIPGPAHASGMGPGGAPSPAHLQALGIPDGGPAASSLPPGMTDNDFPNRLFVAGAYLRLIKWVEQGVPPPSAARLDLDTHGKLILDEFGNAKGGVRNPYVDVPAFRYRTSIEGSGFAANRGTKEILAADILRKLYGAPEAYLAKVAAATDRLIQEGWIPEYGRDVIMADARSVRFS